MPWGGVGIYSFLQAARSKAHYHVGYGLACIIMVTKLSAEGIKICFDDLLARCLRPSHPTVGAASASARTGRIRDGPSNAHNSALRARTELRIELPVSLQHNPGPEIGLSP